MELISIANFVLTILVLIVSVSGFVKIMKNDLTHLQKDTTEIKENINHLCEEVNKLGQRVSTIEGKLSK